MLICVRRQVLSIAFTIALIVGCSHDWTIGSDQAPQQPAEPGTDSGSGTTTPDPTPTPAKDAGPTTPGKDCGRNCVCKGKDKCDFTCTEGNCTLTCEDDANCKLTCGRGASCSIVCKDNVDCALNCADSGRCSMGCEDEANCTGSCKGIGAFCQKDCRRKCDGFKCEEGAFCL